MVNIKCQNGSAIIMTIGITAVLLVLAGAFLGLARAEGVIASRHADYMRSQYLAEAGAVFAKSELSSGLNYPDTAIIKFKLKSEKAEGEVEAKVSKPAEPGCLEIKSTGTLLGRSASTIDLNLTAPAQHNLYAEGLVINRLATTMDVLNKHGIEIDSDSMSFAGNLVFQNSLIAAYQVVNVFDGGFSEPPHVHIYNPPKLDAEYMLKVDKYRAKMFFDGFEYEYINSDMCFSGSKHKKIYFVKGNATILATDVEKLNFNQCIIVAEGDIELLNTGAIPANINGILFAGKSVRIVQTTGNLNVCGAIAANKDIEFDLLAGVVSLESNSGFLNSVPYAFKEKLGYLMAVSD